MKKTLLLLAPEKGALRVIATGERRVRRCPRLARLLPGAIAAVLLVGGLVTDIWWLLIVSLFIALLWQLGGLWETDAASRDDVSAAPEPEKTRPRDEVAAWTAQYVAVREAAFRRAEPDGVPLPQEQVTVLRFVRS